MKDNNRILASVSLFHLFNDGVISLVPLLFPIFKVLFDLSYSQIGLITGTGLLISIFIQFFIGSISDKRNFRTLLLIGMSSLVITLFLFPYIVGFVSLFLLFILLRFSASFFHPLGIGLISRRFKKERLDWAMGIQSAFGDLGVFVAIASTLYIAETIGWRFPFYIWTFIGITAILLGLLLTFSLPKQHLKHETIYKKQSIREKLIEYRHIFSKLRYYTPLLIISGATWGVTLTYLPLFLEETTSISLSIIGFVVSLWIGFGTLASFFYGKIQAKLGRKNVIILCYAIITLMNLLLIVNQFLLLLPFIIALLGIATFLTFPILFSSVSEITHESKEGKTFGFIFTLQLGGGTILSYLSGFLSDVFGIWIPFIFMAFTSIIATLSILLKNNTTQNTINS